MCDVQDMTACHVLLGRPWQYDRKTLHDGYSNIYIVRHSRKLKVDVLVFRAHLTPHCSVESRIFEWFYILHVWYLVLSPWCFKLISGIFEGFKVLTLRTILRHFEWRLEARIGAIACFPRPTQGPCKVRKPSKTSKIRLGQRKQWFDRIPPPFDRMEQDSGEPRCNSGEWA